MYFFPDFYAFPRFAGRRGLPFRLVRGPDGCHKSHAQDHARAGQTASSLLQSNVLTIIHIPQYYYQLLANGLYTFKIVRPLKRHPPKAGRFCI